MKVLYMQYNIIAVTVITGSVDVQPCHFIWLQPPVTQIKKNEVSYQHVCDIKPYYK